MFKERFCINFSKILGGGTRGYISKSMEEILWKSWAASLWQFSGTLSEISEETDKRFPKQNLTRNFWRLNKNLRKKI